MKVKFNKFERVAGFFVIFAVVGAMLVTGGVAVKKGWFTSKVKYTALLDTADGIFEGTQVQMSGLTVGRITHVELLDNNLIKIEIGVFEKFSPRVKEDSAIMVVRPFIIGEKVLDITMGSTSANKALAGSQLKVTPTYDIMDVLSGRRLGPVMVHLGGLLENFKVLAEAFADRKRIEALVKTFDKLSPLVSNLNIMSRQVSDLAHTANKDKRFEHIVANLHMLSQEVGLILPELKKQVPDLADQVAILFQNVAIIAAEFEKLTPAMAAIAPELPRVSLRAVEALDEAVVTLKAMQKTFLLSGNVNEVKDEEKKREPASK